MEMNWTGPFFQAAKVVESKQIDMVLWYEYVCLTH